MNEIETMYYNALVKYLDSQPIFTVKVHGEYVKMKIDKYGRSNYGINIGDDDYFGFTVKPQSVSHGSIADFVVQAVFLAGYIDFNIEIDGHDWHEKTKEQASSDRKKDRKFLASFAPTIRYTGSDIYKDPDSCVVDTLSTISSFIGSLRSFYKDEAREMELIDSYRGVS